MDEVTYKIIQDLSQIYTLIRNISNNIKLLIHSKIQN